jgi:tRNA A-37 threonylcarbamoyl transferase component Bud32
MRSVRHDETPGAERPHQPAGPAPIYCTVVADRAEIDALLRDPRRGGGEAAIRDPSRAVIKSNPRRTVFRAVTASGPLIVKHHRIEGAGEVLRARLAGSRARREIATAQALRAAGIATPQPVALLEDLAAGFAASATHEVADAIPLGSWLEARFTRGDGREAEKRPIVVAAIELLAAMHRQGFDHRDYHGGNVLVTAAAPTAPQVIDLHRVARGDVGARAATAALAALLHTLRHAVATREVDVAFAVTAYARARAAPAAVPEVAAVLRAIAARERRRVASRSRRCVVESSAFTAIDAGGCRGFRRREVAEAELFAAIAAAREHLENGGPSIRSLGRRSSVAIGECAAGRFAVKVYARDGYRRSPRGAWLSRSRRAYVKGHALAVREVAVPGVVAWVQAPDRGILVTSEVADATPLHVLAYSLDARAATAAAAAVATLLERCLEARCFVDDFSPKNVLLKRDGAAFVATLCDFDGATIDRDVTPERLLRALAQLNDVASSVPLRARLHVLRRVRRAASRALPRDAAQRILAMTAARRGRQLATPHDGALAAGSLR